MRLPGIVKVVERIDWCRKKPAINFTFYGCAYGDETFAVVEEPPEDLIGVVWAHELGHMQRLPDRLVNGAVMDSPALKTNRDVDANECRQYRLP